MQNKKESAGDKEELLLKAKSDGLRLLSFRPRSVEELKNKLLDKGHDQALVEEVINHFKKQGLLDDDKFARLYANSRVHTRFAGRRTIETELKQKGVSGAIIAETLKGLSGDTEKETALELARGRFERMTELPRQKQKTRLYGLLKRRGFSDEIVFSVFNELFK